MVDSLKGSVTPDDPQNPSTLSSNINVAEFASQVELEKWVKLAHLEQLGTRAAPAQAFAQPPDWTFSGQRLELYWREVEGPSAEIDNPTEHLSEDGIADEMVARFHADSDPLWDAISAFGGHWELVLPSQMKWDKIERRFVRMHQGDDSTLSLLRRCAISLEHALYRTHP
jgi:hypothetical protein